jgi:hypothetical protein
MDYSQCSLPGSDITFYFIIYSGWLWGPPTAYFRDVEPFCCLVPNLYWNYLPLWSGAIWSWWSSSGGMLTDLIRYLLLYIFTQLFSSLLACDCFEGTHITVRWLLCSVRFLVLMAVSMKMAAFWVDALCRLVEVYWRFRGALMMVAASTSETLVNFYQTTRCNNPEDSHLLRFVSMYFETSW